MTKETKAGTTFETTFDTLTKTPLCAPKTSSVEEITTEAKNGLKSPEMGLKLSRGEKPYATGRDYTFAFGSSLFDDDDIVDAAFVDTFKRASFITYHYVDNNHPDHDRWYVFDKKGNLVAALTKSKSGFRSGNVDYFVDFKYSEFLLCMLTSFVYDLKSYVLRKLSDNDDAAEIIDCAFGSCRRARGLEYDFLGF